MKLPRRLIEEGTAFEREVLASSRLDAGSDRGFKRTLGAMGLGAAAVSVTASTASAGTAAGVAAGSMATWFGGVGLVSVVKWIGLATVLVGGATLSATLVAPLAPAPRATPALPAVARSAVPDIHRAASLASPRTTPQAPTQNAGPTVVAPARPNVVPALPSAPPRVAPAVVVPQGSEPSPAIALKVDGPPLEPEVFPERSAQAIGVRSPSTLDDEVAALDQVRASLSAGDSLNALRQLDAYVRACHACILSDEATVLRVDALMRHGDAAAAATLAQHFLAANPSSPHAPHLRTVTGAAQNP